MTSATSWSDSRHRHRILRRSTTFSCPTPGSTRIGSCTLGERLEREGIEDRDESRRIKVFFDEWDIDYGANIVNRLNDGLHSKPLPAPQFCRQSFSNRAGPIRSGPIGS